LPVSGGASVDTRCASVAGLFVRFRFSPTILSLQRWRPRVDHGLYSPAGLIRWDGVYGRLLDRCDKVPRGARNDWNG
jgi:hypothetical protein